MQNVVLENGTEYQSQLEQSSLIMPNMAVEVENDKMNYNKSYVRNYNSGDYFLS